MNPHELAITSMHQIGGANKIRTVGHASTIASVTDMGLNTKT
jgi:hypothetical protein